MDDRIDLHETYLGDGLYASFDGWQIKLRAPRGYVNHEVYLEPGTFNRLLEYNQKVKGLENVRQS